jgi:hypothetical protein
MEGLILRFESERAELLIKNKLKWIAYSIFGDRRLAETQTVLFKYFINKRGYQHDQFIVRQILEKPDDMIVYSAEK